MNLCKTRAAMQHRLELPPIVPLLRPASLPVVYFILQLAFPRFICFGGKLPLKLRYSRLHKLGAG
jgi:hypothetical protein